MKKGCARALVSLSDPGALAALQPHLETCAECRAIVEAHARLPEVRAPSLDPSIARRIREAGQAELAATPRAPPWWVGALVLCALALGVGLAGAALMPRGNLASSASQIGVGLSPGRRWRGLALGVALFAAAAVVAGGSGSYPVWAGGFWEAGFRCARAVVLYAVPSSVAALLLLRSAAFSPLRALAAGLGTGAAGALALHPHCPIGQAGHLAVFHVLPWLAVAAALLLIERRLTPRTFAP